MENNHQPPAELINSGLEEFRQYLRSLASQGGPNASEHDAFTKWLEKVAAQKAAGVFSAEMFRSIRAELGDALTPQTMQGFALSKPHGYSGDFEIIERIYQQWISPTPNLAKWDEYFHAQAAPRAVRARKQYFKDWLRPWEDKHTNGVFRVLNVASGSARDVSEYFAANPSSRVRVECVDHDANANVFAERLCAPFLANVVFHHANALRFHPPRPVKLVRSAGLFDYLEDGVFVLLLRRLWRAVEVGGELAIGNFCPANPTRPYMELVGEWFLNHRTAEQLTELAKRAEIPSQSVRVASEVEGVNLFLHARKE